MKFSIITPTYNREHLLEHAYEGLCKQTCRDFEWIVVDDGSTDGTEKLIAQISTEAPFPIRYLRQENSGKHVALNRGITVAKGFFIGILDSDDWYQPEALNRCWQLWGQVPKAERDGFAGLTALTADSSGKLVGTRFPKDVLDCNALDLRYKYGVLGDKKGFQRADVLRQFPFPENLGRFVPEGIIWNRIALKFRTRHINEVWCTVNYQLNGLSARGMEHLLGAARASICFDQEFLAFPRRVPLKAAVRRAASLIRFALHTKDATVLKGSKPLLLAGFLPGIALYLRDRYRLRAAKQPTSSVKIQCERRST